jgi:3-(methylthio)propanoyl-CoA dehydrogenase
LVEMAAHIIMSYLLIIDANREPDFMKSAKAYNKIARQVVHGHGEFIRGSSITDPASYKFEL